MKHLSKDRNSFTLQRAVCHSLRRFSLTIIQYIFIYLPRTELSRSDKKMYKIGHIFIYAMNIKPIQCNDFHETVTQRH